MEITTDVATFEAEFEPRILDNNELGAVAGAYFSLSAWCHDDTPDQDEIDS